MTTPRQASTDSTPYWKLLKDARWQRKRLEIMERDNFTCRSCGKSDKDEGTTLNVHHAYYIKGRKPWEYAPNLLTTICSECHELRHQWKREVDEAIARLSKSEFSGLTMFLCVANSSGFLDALTRREKADVNALIPMLKVLEDAWEDGYSNCKDTLGSK